MSYPHSQAIKIEIDPRGLGKMMQQISHLELLKGQHLGRYEDKQVILQRHCKFIAPDLQGL